ncbi:MAG: hypothetical protein LBG06_08515 [Deltaproteobacteria bacterium]|jgi:hypothetical protein|nr:hypothetical protein [Deltaproteobacteria bacterium]
MTTGSPPSAPLAAPAAPALLLLLSACVLAACYPAAAASIDYPRILAGQPPVTEGELQEYIDLMKAAAAGREPLPVVAGGDPDRLAYINVKISGCIQMLKSPSLTAERAAAPYGTPLAAPTPGELEMVRARAADFPAGVFPPRFGVYLIR